MNDDRNGINMHNIKTAHIIQNSTYNHHKKLSVG